MDTQIKPSTIMLIAGGGLLFISTFLPWTDVAGSSDSGLSTDLLGIQGLFCLLIGGAVAVLVALKTFAGVSLPDRILGFSWNQLFMAFGLGAFLIAFGRQFGEFTGIGVLLAWIAAAVIVAGAYMEEAGVGSGGSAPPTQF